MVGERWLLLTVDDYRSPTAKRRKAQDNDDDVDNDDDDDDDDGGDDGDDNDNYDGDYDNYDDDNDDDDNDYRSPTQEKSTKRLCDDDDAALWQNTGQCQLISLIRVWRQIF